jgi:hypothetical protein
MMKSMSSGVRQMEGSYATAEDEDVSDSLASGAAAGCAVCGFIVGVAALVSDVKVLEALELAGRDAARLAALAPTVAEAARSSSMIGQKRMPAEDRSAVRLVKASTRPALKRELTNQHMESDAPEGTPQGRPSRVEFGRFLIGRAPWTPDALLRAAGQKLPALRALLDSVLVTDPSLPQRRDPTQPVQVDRDTSEVVEERFWGL